MAGTVNFYLKKKVENTGKSLIKLRFKYSGNDLVYTFGETIYPSNWNASKQRVKSNKQTTEDGQYSLNDLLDNLQRECRTAYNTLLKDGYPTPHMLRQHLDSFINKHKKDDNKPTLFDLIERFIKNEIKHQGEDKAEETIKKYITVKNHLLAFQSKKKYPVDFETISLEFFYKYIDFLKSKNLKKNTIAKDIQVIKTFLNEAIELGYTRNISHKNKKFTAKWEDVETVYLSDQEILKLYDFDLTNKKSLERARDLFIVGCLTGLRFSDYSSIKPENIVHLDNKGKSEPFLRIKTQKTGEMVIIPCHPIMLKIFEKYKNNANRLPPVVSSQKFNDYIKDACKEAKMNEKGR